MRNRPTFLELVKGIILMTYTTVFVVDEGERQPWSETEWISPPIIDSFDTIMYNYKFLLYINSYNFLYF